MTDGNSRADDGQDERELARKLDDLHQLLYMRGGIKPISAAVDELAKLLLLRIAAERNPELHIDGHGPLSDLLDPNVIRTWPDTSPAKGAFTVVIQLPDLRGSTPDGSTQPVWPIDEPLRISRTDVLAEALSVLAHVEEGRDTRGIDPLGTAFDTFLQGKFDHAGGLGTYLTPSTVARTMATIGFDLFGETPARIVGDPCCGTGRFLAAVVAERVRRFPGLDPKEATNGLIGADQSPNSIAMARVNMLAYGASHPLVFEVGDSITDTSLDELSGQVDLILTNPPFGDAKYDSEAGIERTATFLPTLSGRQKIDPALAFVARCADLLGPGGVAGIVLPDGVLDGPAMRTALLNPQGPTHVAGILSLPSVTFAPGGTTAKTSVLFIRKSDRPSRHVFIAKAEHVGYLKQKTSVVIDPNGDDLPTIRQEVHGIIAGSEPSPLDSRHSASIERAALVSLDASTFDLQAIDARAELLSRGGAEVSQFLTPAQSTRRSKADPNAPFVSVLHVDELGAADWQASEKYSPKTPGKWAPGGSILISLLNPAKFRATVVPERYDGVQCSAEFGIFNAKIDPFAALMLLQHELVKAQIAPLGRGTSSSRRRIGDEDVLTLIAPPFDSDMLAQMAATARQHYESLDAARRGLRSMFS